MWGQTDLNNLGVRRDKIWGGEDKAKKNPELNSIAEQEANKKYIPWREAKLNRCPEMTLAVAATVPVTL